MNMLSNGFSIEPSINDNLVIDDFIVRCAWKGVSCIEGGMMIIKFSDESKITLPNWKKFNCEGIMYTTVGSSDLEKLNSYGSQLNSTNTFPFLQSIIAP